MLSLNATGPAVNALQATLAHLGYLTGFETFGRFGPLTQGAVKWFQHNNGLATDGVVGPLTEAALATAKPIKVSLGADFRSPPADVAAFAQALAEKGITFVLRYANRNDPTKNLTKPEVDAYTAAHIYTGLVWENGYPISPEERIAKGLPANYFTPATGIEDGQGAAEFAQTLGFPNWAPIRFAADYSPPASDFPMLDDYFSAVAQGVGGDYPIWGYGSGALGAYLLAHNPHVTGWWLAGSPGWSGYDDFLLGQRWNLKQGPNGILLAGVQVDIDVSLGNGGGWLPGVSQAPGNPEAEALEKRIQAAVKILTEGE